jgi:phage tail-like protein
MPTVQRNDPYSAMNFVVELDGITVAAFRECSGLASELTVIEYRNGSDRGSARKLPGMQKYTNITLKRGITGDRQLWDWHKTALDGSVQRKNGSIVLLDESGQEVVRWNFRQGWPSKYEGPTLNASANEVAIETLEIAHEGLELD